MLLHSRTILLAADNLIPNCNLPLNNQLRYCQLATKLPIFVGENISGKKLAFTMLIGGNVSHKHLCCEYLNNNFDFTCEYQEL